MLFVSLSKTIGCFATPDPSIVVDVEVKVRALIMPFSVGNDVLCWGLEQCFHFANELKVIFYAVEHNHDSSHLCHIFRRPLEAPMTSLFLLANTAVDMSCKAV